MPGLAERHQHRLGEIGHFGELVGDAEAAALLAGGLLLALQRFLGAVLQLGGELVVEALDRGQLVELDIGDLLQRAEALGDEQLGERLVHVELVLEHLGALDELALALLARIGLGHDVDRRAGQLAGQADILAAAADGEATAGRRARPPRSGSPPRR